MCLAKPLRGNLMYARLVTGITMLALATLTTAAQAQMQRARTGIPVGHNLPPAQMLMEPGPGVGGPGPGVLNRGSRMGGPGSGAAYGPFGAVTTQSVQVLFDRPEMMQVAWDVSGIGRYDSTPLTVPGRQNFAQGGIFRLKVTNIEGRPGMELYPTLEIGRSNKRTSAYLAHAAVPIQFTAEDFDQVAAANFVTKVIYVPDPAYQELALAGVDTLVSTRLDPGVDPITEADRRGSILAIVRIGNKDLEVPGVDPAIAAGAMPMGMGMNGGVSDYISGVTGPNYGMPSVGTNIGLPGPPHIPLGGPAGLRRYDIHNHTAMQIPGPTPRVDVHVRQKPGLSYPRPADRVLIQENTIRPPHYNGQPPADMVRGVLQNDCEDCPPANGLRR
ncbi:MAG: hypothetical protein ACI814_002234 [Mariniblastus sp.]|jgi:hypothetical protein